MQIQNLVNDVFTSEHTITEAYVLHPQHMYHLRAGERYGLTDTLRSMLPPSLASPIVSTMERTSPFALICTIKMETANIYVGGVIVRNASVRKLLGFACTEMSMEEYTSAYAEHPLGSDMMNADGSIIPQPRAVIPKEDEYMWGYRTMSQSGKE